jgi:kynurenine formamidase
MPRKFVDLSIDLENVQLTTHNGTHLGAPYDFHSTMDKALGAKNPAIAIHEVQLEWCFQPAVKLDFRDKADGYVGARLTGTDAWSWDTPFVHTAKKNGETHDASLIWEGHRAGRDIGYCHIEKLHDLEVLPSNGSFISCFPHKIRGASAGWTRAVAIFDDALMALV